MNQYQVVCEDYAAHKFNVMGIFYRKKRASQILRHYLKGDPLVTRKVYRLVEFKL